MSHTNGSYPSVEASLYRASIALWAAAALAAAALACIPVWRWLR